MFSISHLAERCGLSRSTILYYESIGLLPRAPRTAGNYRAYSQGHLSRLEQICVYRDAGLKLEDIRELLDRPHGAAASVLQRRLSELAFEIERLRAHQAAILRLLQNETLLRRSEVMTKEKWVSIMKAAGFTEADMRRWHVEFERSAPQDHQDFLEYLHIPAEEVRSIREWSQTSATA